MDFQKKIKIYVGTLIGLGALAFLGVVFSTGAGFQREASIPLVALDPQQIEKIQLPGGAVVQKRGGQWDTTQGAKTYPANLAKIEGFLKDLKSATRTQVVSRGEENLAMFSLDKANAKRLELTTSDGRTTAVLIGKAGTSGDGVYVKIDGPSEKDIILTQAALSRNLEGDYNLWTDLKVFDVPMTSDEVVSVTFKGQVETSTAKYESYELYRQVDPKTGSGKPGWYLKGTDQLVEKASSALNTLMDYKASENLPQSQTFDKAKVQGTLTIVLGNGRRAELLIGPRDSSNRFPVSTGTRDFILAEYLLDQVLIKKP